ncbi:hypothetical protein [Streptomyces sp. NPDC048340]|uniref:hypothetical protein n=1 Tax=Streptomyces sp. NPDC048340 TaxID=3365537 RepID=UPI003712E877
MPGPVSPAPSYDSGERYGESHEYSDGRDGYEDAAQLSVSAACELVVPRVSSATVVGTGPAVAAHVAGLARRMPCLGNITVYPGPAYGPPRWPSARIAALAAEQGIALLGADTLDRALLGADLVVLTDGAAASAGSSARRRALLAPDAVVVRAVTVPSASGPLPGGPCS